MRLDEETCKRILDFLSIRLTGSPCQIGQVDGEKGHAPSYKLMFGGVSVFMRKKLCTLKVKCNDAPCKSFLEKIIRISDGGTQAAILSSQLRAVPVISPGTTIEQLLLEIELNEIQ